MAKVWLAAVLAAGVAALVAAFVSWAMSLTWDQLVAQAKLLGVVAALLFTMWAIVRVADEDQREIARVRKRIEAERRLLVEIERDVADLRRRVENGSTNA